MPCNRQLSAYNSSMAKKTTLTSIAAQIEKGFGAVASDIADIKRDMATKDQVIALHTQVNSIERQLRDMKHIKLEDRVAGLEEKVFGKVRT